MFRASEHFVQGFVTPGAERLWLSLSLGAGSPFMLAVGIVQDYANATQGSDERL